MPLTDDWPKTPEDYRVHRLCDTEAWDISIARRRSLGHMTGFPQSQYNPHLVGEAEIFALELYCIEHGTILTPIGSKQYHFFLDCRDYFHDRRVVLGYCDGQKVCHVYVKWSKKGYHGYPVTIEYLRLKGADI